MPTNFVSYFIKKNRLKLLILLLMLLMDTSLYFADALIIEK